MNYRIAWEIVREQLSDTPLPVKYVYAMLLATWAGTSVYIIFLMFVEALNAFTQ